ncbi:glycoside hydrolase family 28 protein [Ferruginibacter albus]|uniref:glycoside hydrolase family 28 protein n=1 Tax=Ferruginibacter albus TaxID=2875540 RepID=UPI001CC4FB55|nr:glycoside hydrolase family 28 protein [Ferruginibacter albus]UAY53390.1 glycoside hydrolase family 28 protein [Ferruginibacter albus]
MKLFAKRSLVIVITTFTVAVVNAQVKNIAYYISKAPFTMPQVTAPTFADKTFSITDYGAVADDKTLNTAAFAKAIEACTNAGGGKVLVPAGTWITGPIELKSNVDLHLEKGALVQFTSDHKQYPMIKLGGGNNISPQPPLYAYKATNIALTGQGIFDGAGDTWRPVKKSKAPAEVWQALPKTGVISSDGKIWWPSGEAMAGEVVVDRLKDNTNATPDDYITARDFLRPYMLQLISCENILIDGVALRNSPKFVLYPNKCTNLIISNATIFNDWWAQNGDGMDISACKNVVVYKTTVSAGDDGICMKSSNYKDSTPQLQNIIVAGCTVLRAHGGFVIGSNTDGQMKNIYVADCKFIGSDIGVRVKSNYGRGGLVTNVYVDNITMSAIPEEAILFTTDYEDVVAGKSAKGVSATDKAPEFANFHFSNIRCTQANTAISIKGLPDVPAHDIYFDNVDITAKNGFSSTDAKNIFLNNVLINGDKPEFSTKRTSNVVLDGKVIVK